MTAPHPQPFSRKGRRELICATGNMADSLSAGAKYIHPTSTSTHRFISSSVHQFISSSVHQFISSSVHQFISS
ncbi:hypothetical protein, partial [Aeromonas hydrophila]